MPRWPLPPNVISKSEEPWLYTYKGLPGSPEERPRRIDHATLYHLEDEYGRKTVGVVPESKYLNDLLYEWRTFQPLELNPNYNYIGTVFAAMGAIDPRAVISVCVVYGVGAAHTCLPYIWDKRRIAQVLNDPECADFVAAL